MGVFRLHHFPDWFNLFHQLYDVLPFFLVILTHGLCPEVSILMDRRFRRGYSRIYINGVIVGKAVCVTLWCKEKHRLALHKVVFHLRSNGDGVQGCFDAPFFDIWDLHVFSVHIPFLCIFVDEVRQHLVIEGNHTFHSDFDIIRGECLVVSFHDIFCQFLSHQLFQFFILHFFCLMAIDDFTIIIHSKA